MHYRSNPQLSKVFLAKGQFTKCKNPIQLIRIVSHYWISVPRNIASYNKLNTRIVTI